MIDYRLNDLIVTLTVGELKDLIRELIPTQEPTPVNSGNYVYGLRGIAELFGVSHKTAQIYKNGILRPAVRQYGRKIVTDVDQALELFNRRHAK